MQGVWADSVLDLRAMQLHAIFATCVMLNTCKLMLRVSPNNLKSVEAEDAEANFGAHMLILTIT
jgi:hypothetical protein